MSMKNPKDTHSLPACSAVPQPTAPPTACRHIILVLLVNLLLLWISLNRLHCLTKNCYIILNFALIKDFLLHFVNFTSNNLLPPEAITTLCSFTSYEPWTNKDITPAAARERKRISPFQITRYEIKAEIITIILTAYLRLGLTMTHLPLRFSDQYFVPTSHFPYMLLSTLVGFSFASLRMQRK